MCPAPPWPASTGEQPGRIARYLQETVATGGDPRQRGKGLTANLAGLWRYRVGDDRVICQIEAARLVVLMVRISHRSEAYC